MLTIHTGAAMTFADPKATPSDADGSDLVGGGGHGHRRIGLCVRNIKGRWGIRFNGR